MGRPWMEGTSQSWARFLSNRRRKEGKKYFPWAILRRTLVLCDRSCASSSSQNWILVIRRIKSDQLCWFMHTRKCFTSYVWRIRPWLLRACPSTLGCFRCPSRLALARTSRWDHPKDDQRQRSFALFEKQRFECWRKYPYLVLLNLCSSSPQTRAWRYEKWLQNASRRGWAQV